MTSTMVDRGRIKRCLSAKLAVRPLVDGESAIKPLENADEKKGEEKDSNNTTIMLNKDASEPDNNRPIMSITNVTVDTSKAKSNSDVIRMCLAELGWQDCARPGAAFGSCDIVWQSSTASHEGRDSSINTTPATAFIPQATSGSLTRINKFPCKIKIFVVGFYAPYIFDFEGLL